MSQKRLINGMIKNEDMSMSNFRCLRCGCSQFDAQGVKCDRCGGAMGPRHEECDVTEQTKTKLLQHAAELSRFGIRVEQYKRVQKNLSAGDVMGGLALALACAESFRNGVLGDLVWYLRDRLSIPEEEVLRLRLDEPERILSYYRMDREEIRKIDAANTKRFETSVQVRNFEIDLFWKRSLFFWGFISAAFIAYAALWNSQSRIIVACFGMVCSFSWTLVNRGSKYWQESWEAKVEDSEPLVTGGLFAKEEARQAYKGRWLSGRKYSVSKLTIALSDYVFVLWSVLVIREIILLYLPLNEKPWLTKAGATAFVIFSAIYVVLLLWYGRKSHRPNGQHISVQRLKEKTGGESIRGIGD